MKQERKKERKQRINGPRAEMSYELALQENCSVPSFSCRLMSIIKKTGGTEGMDEGVRMRRLAVLYPSPRLHALSLSNKCGK